MPPTTPSPTVADHSTVTLREITAETVRSICDLRVAPSQEAFVDPNATSLAEAHVSPRAWFRAIYADETPVGFVMLKEPETSAVAGPDPAAPFLWRLMIVADRQGQGIGRRTLDLVIAEIRQRYGATELLTSCVPGDGSPCGFYRALGFAETGEIDDSEIVMRLALPNATPTGARGGSRRGGSPSGTTASPAASSRSATSPIATCAGCRTSGWGLQATNCVPPSPRSKAPFRSPSAARTTPSGSVDTSARRGPKRGA